MPKFHDKTNGRFFDVPDDQMDQFGAAVLQNKWEVEPAETYVTRDRQTFNVAKSAEKKWLQNRADTGLSFGSWDGEDWVTQVDKKDVKSDGSDLGVYLKKDLEAWNEFSIAKQNEEPKFDLGKFFKDVGSQVKDFMQTPEAGTQGSNLVDFDGKFRLGFDGVNPTKPEAISANQNDQSGWSTGRSPDQSILTQVASGNQPALSDFSTTPEQDEIVSSRYNETIAQKVKDKKPGWIGLNYNRYKDTINRGMINSELVQLMHNGDAEGIADALSRQDNLKPHPSYAKFSEAVSNNNIKGMFKALGKDPVGIFADIILESQAAQIKQQLKIAPEMIMTSGMGGGALGLLGGPLTASAGFLGGISVGFIASVGSTAQVIDYAGDIVEGLEKEKVDVRDPEQLEKAFADEDLMKRLKNHASRSSIPMGIMEALGAKFAGKFVAKAGSSALKKLSGIIKEFSASSFAGMSGEFLSQLVAGDEIQAAPIIVEGIAELGSAAGDAAIGSRTYNKKKGISKKNADGSITITSKDDSNFKTPFTQTEKQTESTEPAIVSDPAEAKRLRDEAAAARVDDSELSPLGNKKDLKLKPEAQADVERNKEKGYGEASVDTKNGAVYQEATPKRENGKEKVVRRYVTTGGALDLHIGDTVDEGHNVSTTTGEDPDNLRNDDTDVYVVDAILDPATDKSNTDAKIRIVKRRATDEELAKLEKGKAKAASMRAELAEKDVGGITSEAYKLVKAYKGKTPDKITTGMRRIAKQNKVSIAAKDRPADVIRKLQDKENAYQSSLNKKSSKSEVNSESDIRNLNAQRKVYEDSLANKENPPNSEEIAYLNDEIAKIDKQLGVKPINMTEDEWQETLSAEREHEKDPLWVKDRETIKRIDSVVNEVSGDKVSTDPNDVMNQGGKIRSKIYELLGLRKPDAQRLFGFRIGSLYRDSQRIAPDLQSKYSIQSLTESIIRQEAEEQGLDPDAIMGRNSSLTEQGKLDLAKNAKAKAESIASKVMAAFEDSEKAKPKSTAKPKQESKDVKLPEPPDLSSQDRQDVLKGKSKLEETRGKGKQYHGTSKKIDEVSGRYGPNSDQNIYGGGLYTTDASDVAVGYSGKGKGKSPSVYEVTENENLSIYDIEAEATTVEANAVNKVVPDNLPSIGEKNLDGDEIKTVRDLYDAIRDESASQEISTSEVQETFNEIMDVLSDLGHDGMRHTGGKRTGTSSHEVKIYFDPQKSVTIKEVDPLSLKKKSTSQPKQEAAPVTPQVAESKPYSKDNIKEAMDLTNEEAEAVDVLVESLGIADEIETGRGGVAGENALNQRGQTKKLSKADQKSVDESGKTAISRSKTSTLVRGLDESNVSGRVLHQGAGRSNNPDRNALETISEDVVHYDPTHSPETEDSLLRGDFDTVVTPFVVNTLKPSLRKGVYVDAAKSLAPDGKVIVSARGDVEKQAETSKKKGKPWKPFKDGYITNTGTFQKNYTTESLVKEAKKYFDNVEVMLDKDGKPFRNPTIVASSPKAVTLRGEFTKSQKIFKKRKRNIVETKAQRKFSGRADTIPTSRISSAKKESGEKDFDLFDVEPSDQLVSWQMEAIRHDRNNPGYAGVPKEVFDTESPQKAKEIYVEWLKNNLIKLHNSVPKKIRVRAKLWYDGSRKIAEEFSETYGTSVRQAAGVLAALSPQKNWFYNVTQARQVIAIWKTKEEFGTSPEVMEQTIEEIIEVAKAPAAAKKGKSEARKKALDAEAKQERREAFEPVRGKTVGELYAIYEKTGLEDDLTSVGWAVRARAQAQFGREANAFTPEGKDLGPYTNEEGKVLKNTWGSISEITKSINILADDSLDTISENLGNEHKVRNFYNNIINPNDARGYVTIDTHAVAAAHILPFGASARPVKHNFGTNAIGNMAAEGFNGSYHMYQDAYDQAARELKLLPRELQSIVWEAIRGIYPQNLKNEAYLQEKASVWEQNNENTARERLAGQKIRDPFWFNPVHDRGVKADEGVLRGAQDAGGSPVDRGGSARGSRGLEQRSNATGSVLGTMEVLDSGKALIRGFKGSNISTALHEIAHVVRNTLLNRSVDQSSRKGITNEDISVVEEWAGAKDGKWTVEAEEKFARGMERYLRDGVSPNAKLNDVFSKIQAWLIEIYAKIEGSAIDIDISPEMRAVFDKLLTRSDTKPEKNIAASNADQAKTRTKLGLSGERFSGSKKRGVFENAKNEAIEAGIPEDAVSIANQVIANPRVISKLETAGMTVKQEQILIKHNKLLKEQKGMTGNNSLIEAHENEMSRLEIEFDAISQALEIGGTEVSLAFGIRKMILGEDFSYIGIVDRATRNMRKAKETISNAQKIIFRGMADKLSMLEEKSEMLESKLKTAIAEQVIKKGKSRTYSAMKNSELSALIQDKAKLISDLRKKGCS